MKAKSLLALTLALIMTVSMCFAFSAVAEEEVATDTVYDPRAILNELAGDCGIGGSLHSSGNKTTVDFTDSVFSVKAYNSSANTKKPNQTVDMNTATFQSDSTNYRLRYLGASGVRGSLEVFEYNRGGADRRALWWIRGDKWREEEPLLIFTAPKDGTYDITAAANSPEVKFSNNAKNNLKGDYENMTVTFSVEKYAQGAAVLASANVLNSVTIGKTNNYKADFPAVEGVELKAGEMIVFRLSSDLARNVDSGSYRTETEATPIITRRAEEEITPPTVITTPLTYDARAILNGLAGDYGIGGSQYANGNSTTVDYTGSVFSVKAYNGPENTKKANAVLDMNTAKFVPDSTNNRLKFLGTYGAAGTTSNAMRGSLEIFQYGKNAEGTRALWWMRGDKWREEEPMLIFTAPYDGIYDITAAADSSEVKFSNTAKTNLTGNDENLSVTFSVEKYGVDAAISAYADATVLNSVTISKATNYKGVFPAVEGLELKAGEMIVFRLTSDLAINADSRCYKTETEATPIITRRADVVAEVKAPITNLGAQIRGIGSGEDTTALRFGFELPCTGVNYEDATHAGGNYKRALTADSKVVINGQAYTVTDFGAVLSLNEDAALTLDEQGGTVVVPAINLYEAEADKVMFTAVVVNVPVAQADTKIYARSYVTYTDGEDTVTVYGDVIDRCLTDCGYDALV